MSFDYVPSLDAEVFGGLEEMGVVGVDFTEAMFLGADEMESFGGAEKYGSRQSVIFPLGGGETYEVSRTGMEFADGNLDRRHGQECDTRDTRRQDVADRDKKLVTARLPRKIKR